MKICNEGWQDTWQSKLVLRNGGTDSGRSLALEGLSYELEDIAAEVEEEEDNVVEVVEVAARRTRSQTAQRSRRGQRANGVEGDRQQNSRRSRRRQRDNDVAGGRQQNARRSRQRLERSATGEYVGRKVLKYFISARNEPFTGVVVSYNHPWWFIRYEDDETEEMNRAEVEAAMQLWTDEMENI